MTEICVSIINFRTGPMTIACVQSVLADLGDIPAQVVVVDNLSGDGSADEIAAWIAAQPAPCPVRLVRSASNSGFSGGHNQGIAAGTADLYVLLNSDALIRPGFFAALRAGVLAHPRAGIFGCRIEDESGAPQASCFRFPSAFSELDRAAATGPVTRLLASHVVSLGPTPDLAALEWVSFACVALRHEMVTEIGPLDEGYFMYFEDVDYCHRAQAAGWQVRHLPQALVMHEEGGSGEVVASRAARRRMPRYYYASRTRFFRKTRGGIGPWAANLMWHLGRGVAQLRRLTARAVPPAVAHEARDIWTNIADPLGPRHGPPGS